MMEVPVTIVTGYLGSGKTTLLRSILSGSGGLKIAIVMNEFGRIPIDSKVIAGKDVRIAELAGGCVCCSLSGEFVAAISEIMKTARPDRIVVETTGVAEPSSLIYEIEENLAQARLDAVITVVDADALVRSPSIGHTGREQIELADMILLNKTDLVGTEEADGIERRLRGINPKAELRRTRHCGIGIDEVFRNMHRADAHEAHPVHEPESMSFEIATDAALDHEGFLKFLASLPEAIYRAKGFVKTGRGTFLMDYVAGRHTMEPFPCSRTELVFISSGALAARDESDVREAIRGLGFSR